MKEFEQLNDIAQQREHFEKIADLYNKSRSDPKHLFLKKHIWECFFKELHFPTADKLHILEAMCGSAEFLDILRKHLDRDFTYDAFDYSEKMVAFSKEKNPDINIWIQDVTTFCAPESYDVIYILGGLHHVHHFTDKVLCNISRSLRPGGFFINLEPTHNNPLFALIRRAIYWKNSFFDKETERGFTTVKLNKAALSHDMHLIHQIYPGLLAYVLWYNPDVFPLLNKGSLSFAEKFIMAESKIWGSKLARFFSFATLSCYRKEV
jgi:SAM-dependent methyltransferase